MVNMLSVVGAEVVGWNVNSSFLYEEDMPETVVDACTIPEVDLSDTVMEPRN
jgi:hypothetical protein